MLDHVYSGSFSTLGVQKLFEHLIAAIIVRKDLIERENELKKRNSVYLDTTPSWSKPPVDDYDKPQRSGSWTCC